MSKLSELAGNAKTYEIGGISLSIKPLTLRDVNLFSDFEDKTKRAEAIATIMRKTLKESVPDATDEEIEDVGLTYLDEIMHAILEVNKLDSKKNQSFLKKIKDAQSQGTSG